MPRIDAVLYSKEGNAQHEVDPRTSATQVTIQSEDGTPSTVEAEIVALRAVVSETLTGGTAFKGVVTLTEGLPTVAYKKGWQYQVQEAGTYAGKECEVGDFIVSVKDYASGSASNSDWAVLQVNIVGAVTGPASSVTNRVAVFDGTSGKNIKDSGFTIGKSVPADAEFTDTTYASATAQANGLMTSAQYTKLAGIEAGADKTDATNVDAAGAFMVSTDTTDIITEGTISKFMTADEKTKLAGIANGAGVNQNAFTKVQVGDTLITADEQEDTLSLVAGTGITITPDNTAGSVTLTESFVDSCLVTNLANVPDNLRNGGLIILKQ